MSIIAGPRISGRNKLRGWKKPTDIRQYKIDWSNPLTRDLRIVAVTDGGGCYNMVDGRPYEQTAGASADSGSIYGQGSTKTGNTEEHYNSAVADGAITPKTSDGAGGGAIAMMQLANPVAESNRRISFSSNSDSFHCSLMPNTSSSGTSASNGAWSFLTHDGTYSGAGAGGVLDGHFHLGIGQRREDNVMEMWVDGVNYHTVSRTNRDVYSDTATDHQISIGGYAQSNSFAIKDTVLLSVCWDRELSEAEIKSLSKDPWQFLRPVAAANDSFFYTAAAAGVNISVGTDSQTYTTYAVDVTVARNIDVGTASQTYTTYAVDVNVARNIDVGVATQTYTTYPVTVTVAGSVEVLVGTATQTYTTYPVTVSKIISIDVGTASQTYTTFGVTVALSPHIAVNITSAAQTYTSYAVTVEVESIYALAGNRVWVVSVEDRTRAIKADDRTIRINVEDRTFRVKR